MGLYSIAYTPFEGKLPVPCTTSLANAVESSTSLLTVAALVAIVALAIWGTYRYFYGSAATQTTALLPSWDETLPQDCCRQIDLAIAANGGYEQWRAAAKADFESRDYPISEEHDDIRAYYVLEQALKSDDHSLALKHLTHATKHFNVINTELLCRLIYQHSIRKSFLRN